MPNLGTIFYLFQPFDYPNGLPILVAIFFILSLIAQVNCRLRGKLPHELWTNGY